MNDVPSSASSTIASEARPDRSARQRFWRYFWLAFLVVSLAYAWHSFYVPSNSIAWAEDYTSAQEQAIRSGKPMILFFSATWCVPCRIMKRNVWADGEVTAAVNGAYVPVTIDVDDPASAAVLRRYEVGITPKTVVTDPRGNVLQQRDGGLTQAEFLGLLGQ